jgi:hypothetical protein
MTPHDPDSKRALLRHTVATLAYRGGKSIRGAPAGFAALHVGDTTRTPLAILAHIGDLLEWALSLAEGVQRWPKPADRTWDQEVDRFFGGLARFDGYLASEAPLAASPEKLFQGPVADALTHVGQIGLLRRMAAAPVRGENYYLADIETGRIGGEQSAPRREFD